MQGWADDSFLFTLEEFGREVLFLLDTVEEVSHWHLLRKGAKAYVQIVTAQNISAWGHVKSLVFISKARKRENKRYLHTQLRKPCLP
jgi:hypothetical protein